jgi:hypothetical protein
MEASSNVEAGPEHPPGSPEDLQVMTEVLSGFFAEKMKAIDLFRSGASDGGTSTGSTKSICHIDGKDDGDEKQPDV